MSKYFYFAFFIVLISGYSTANGESKCHSRLKALSSTAEFDLQIGDQIDLELDSAHGKIFSDLSFLGLGRNLDGSPLGAFFFDPQRMQIDFIPITEIQFYSADQTPLDINRIAPVVRSINQEGGSCAAYAIFNGVHQLCRMNSIGNGMIVHHLADETGRNRLFTRITMEYYGDETHVGTEHEIARELGYEMERLNTRSVRDLADSLRRAAESNWPSFLYFDVGPEMWRTPYVIVNQSSGEKADQRLWLPKDSASRKYAGHQILVVKTFEDAEGQEWIEVIDSNWQAPRLWKIGALDRLESGEIGGWTVWQKGRNPRILPPKPEAPFFRRPRDLRTPLNF